MAVPMADLDWKFTKRPIRSKDNNTKRLETCVSSTNVYQLSFATSGTSRSRTLSLSPSRQLTLQHLSRVGQANILAGSTHNPSDVMPQSGALWTNCQIQIEIRSLMSNYLLIRCICCHGNLYSKHIVTELVKDILTVCWCACIYLN